ncbi:thiamine pyrophosphate-binding protein [Pedobacter sp. GSP4]|uniref:thiamine pyrophosphate-binding protein n=1 Tax=Pedobacter sp. GSP4 TaxID=3453716 RepID=UPI003EEB3182
MAKLVKVSDLIVKFFEQKGVKHVFLLSGGMMMNLLDSVSRSEQIKYICNHHEQAAAMAAEAYARVKNEVAVCYATSGPGATNTVTGIAGAWLDSTPVIYLTGQSRTSLTVMGSGIKDLRMLGNFEVNITEIVKPITKYTVFLNDPNEVLYHLEKAYYLASTGRPGPVLLDVPLDIQGASVDEDQLKHFITPQEVKTQADFEVINRELQNSLRPLIIGGHGVSVANQVEEFRKLVHHLNVPVVTTPLANDLMPYDDELHIGRVGLRGNRAGNFAVQSADVIITIGTSLHITTTGYEQEDFAPNAKKIVIDLDSAVLKKNQDISQIQIQADVATVLDFMMQNIEPLMLAEWVSKLQSWKQKFPIINEPHLREGNEINTYHLMDVLSKSLKGDEILLTDAGSLYYITGQAFLAKKNQRVIISGALGAMGYALPASIGAACAAPDKDIICVTGDGSMQLNVQELQTIVHYNLNCKIIVINNNGYASIRNSQTAFTGGRLAGSSEDTGVTFPNWQKLADAYGIPFISEKKFDHLESTFVEMISTKGPLLIEIVVPENVTMIPAVTSVRLPNGSFKSNRLHEMVPELSEEQLREANVTIN